MNSKDFEKMVEIMISLEPMNPRSVLIDELFDSKTKMHTNLEMENSNLFLKRRKPSLPNIQILTVLGNCHTGRRQSLFQNDKIYPSNSLQKLATYQRNTNDITEFSSDTESPNVISNNFSPGQDFLRNHKNVPVYDSINRASGIKDRTSRNSEFELTSGQSKDHLTSFIIDGRKPKNLLHRNSMELLKMKDLKHPQSPDKVSEPIIVEDKKEINIDSVVSPQSIEGSSYNWSISIEGDHSSIESRSDHVGTKIFRSMPSNDATDGSVPEKKIFSPNKQSSLPYSPLYFLRSSDSESDPCGRTEEIVKPNSNSSILSEEEQKKFYRRLSSKISLDTFSIKEIIKIYMRNGISSAQIIDKFQTAGSVCKTLKQKYLLPEGRFCQIIEVITKESLERPLEDHENILDIFSSWKEDNIINRFIFDENTNPYRLFDQPSMSLEESECNFDISEIMWIKATNTKWMRVTCLIKGNCIYYSMRPGSKDQKDLNCLTNLKTSDVYTCYDLKRIKKEVKAPTMELIVFKENKIDHRLNENSYIAPITTQQKEKWLEAITVAKFSFRQLKNNHSEYRTRFLSELKGNVISDIPGDDTQHLKEASSI